MLSPAAKALWYIETHFQQPLTLPGIAAVVGVSPWYLTRAFGLATGKSIIRYMRERRLSEAARSLAGLAPDILTVALDAGYNSHEAFSRAFREQFGVTPEALRSVQTSAQSNSRSPSEWTNHSSQTFPNPELKSLARY